MVDNPSQSPITLGVSARSTDVELAIDSGAGGANPPLMQTMIEPAVSDLDIEKLPKSYQEAKGTKFAKLIETGCFQVVKGRYFEHCWDRKQLIQPRQRIPLEFVWKGTEAVELWEKYGSAFLVVISYPWLDKEHPDPEMWHLERLAEIIVVYRQRVTEDSLNHSGDKLDCGDIGIIMDFTSLWQCDLVNGVDQRTPVQRMEFKLALSDINTPYGHSMISCWILWLVPAHVERKYDDRGWTLFEKTIINAKGPGGAKDRFVRNVVVFDVDLSLKGALTKNLFHNDPKGMVWTCTKRGVPLTPERFKEELQLRSDKAKAKNVALFTNGKEDWPLVEKRYTESFQQLLETNELNFNCSGWTKAEALELANGLPMFHNLKTLQVAFNPIGSDGALALVRALPPGRFSYFGAANSGIGVKGLIQILYEWSLRNPGVCSCNNCCCAKPAHRAEACGTTCVSCGFCGNGCWCVSTDPQDQFAFSLIDLRFQWCGCFRGT